jgi:hypothetical protein
MSFESDNARQLAKLIIDQGVPHPEETIPPISISSGALGVSNRGIGKMCLDIVSKATKTKSPHYKDSYLKSTRTIIYSLIVAGFSFAHLALGTRIKPNSYLASLGLTRRHVEAITSALIDSGHATKSRGGYRHHGSPHLSKSTQYLPTEKLLTNYCELLYEPAGDFDNYEAYIFKGANRWEDDWESKALTVRKYNEFMRNFTWAQKAPTYRSLGAEPFTSGRMYTPYQNIVNRRIAIRTQTLLNGQPLCEVDFKSNHLWLLAAFFKEDLPDDPYVEVAEKIGCSRDSVKRLLNPLLGAENTRGLVEIKYKLYDIDNELIDDIVASLNTTFPWLNRYKLIFNGVGSKLQYVEGEVALRMFEWGVREGIPLINIHDAFAVSLEHRTKTYEAMHQFRNDVIKDMQWFIPYLTTES